MHEHHAYEVKHTIDMPTVSNSSGVPLSLLCQTSLWAAGSPLAQTAQTPIVGQDICKETSCMADDQRSDLRPEAANQDPASESEISLGSKPDLGMETAWVAPKPVVQPLPLHVLGGHAPETGKQHLQPWRSSQGPPTHE